MAATATRLDSPVDPGDVITFSRRLIRKAGLRRELRRGGFELASLISLKEIGGKDNALALAAG